MSTLSSYQKSRACISFNLINQIIDIASTLFSNSMIITANNDNNV